jgi:hypothetical protein
MINLKSNLKGNLRFPFHPSLVLRRGTDLRRYDDTEERVSQSDMSVLSPFPCATQRKKGVFNVETTIDG